MRLTKLIAVLVLAVVACRSDDNNNPPADSNGSNNGSGGVTIQMVQDDGMAAGTPVSLYGVVVTAIDSFGDKTGDIWVEEPGGGKRSGVHVYKGTAYSGMAVGDVINVTGAIKTEFALTGSNADPSGRTETELEPATSGSTINLTKVSTGAPITPDKVDALAIGQMYDSTMSATGGGSAFTNAWEDWEGVLVEVDNVAASSAPKGFGTTPYAADAYAFNVTGVAKVEGTMTDITMSSIARATCFSKMVGVVDYFYDYLVLPRSTGDFATGGTSCPAAETSCSDNIDNDGNGFTDCADNGCVLSSATCRSTSTIQAITTATTLPTTPQEIGSTESVCVTAVGFNGTDFWVSKGPGVAAANQGMYIYSGGTPLASGIAVNTKVDVIGTPKAYNNDTTGGTLLEFNEVGATSQTGACTVTPALAQSAATLSVDATGRPMIGSLVQLTNVAVVTVGNAGNHGAGTMKQAGTTFEYQSDILAAYLATTEVGKCYATITGIWSYDVYNNAYSLEPLAAGTGTGACN